MPDTPAHIRPFTINSVLERLRRREIDQAEAMNLIISLGGNSAEAQELIRRVITTRPGAGDITPPTPPPPVGGAGGVPSPTPQRGPPGGPPFDESPFGANITERREAFQGFLGNRFSSGIDPRASAALGRQFDAISPAFQFSRGLGAIGPGTDFREFLSQNLGGANFDLTGLAREAAGLFGQDLSGADQGLPDALRTELISNPRMGFNLALQSGLQGIPEFLRGSFTQNANRAFSRFRTGVPIDQITGLPDFANNPFLPEFFKRGGSFGAF